MAISFIGAPNPAPLRSGGAGEGPRQSIWQGLADDSEFLVLLGFPDAAAAEDDLRQIIEGEENSAPEANLPTEVHHIEIEHQRGEILDGVPIGAFLAVTRSQSNPGYGDEARERLGDMLSTFVQVEGFCGHLLGVNASSNEEAWSFVFGTNHATLPVPENSEVAVRLYRRLR